MATTASSHDESAPQPHFQALRDSLKGELHFPGNQTFADQSKIFNGAIRTKAIALALPADTLDVSKIITFCSKHKLSPSIKAGGYGTAGASIGGDIIVDLRRLRGMAIDPPDDSTPREYVSLRDQLSPTDKGKGKAKQPPVQTVSASDIQVTDVAAATSTTLKRRREAEEAEDEEEKAAYEARLRTYNPAAPRVASFLDGPPLAPEPGVSRRLPPQDYRAPRLSASNSAGSEADSPPVDTDGQRPSENLTSPPVDSRGPFDHMNLAGESSSADAPRPTPWFPSRVRPFDYLSAAGSSEDTGSVQHPTYQQTVHTPGGLASFPTFSSNTPFSGPAFPSLDIPDNLPRSSAQPVGESCSFPASASSLFSPYPQMDWENHSLHHRSQLEPRYPHVYVSFGAGVLQKEIDLYTADNPVEAKEAANGMAGLIPYHVPTAAHPTGSAIMVLGGFGFLSRLRGLSIDNLVEVEMVLADGSTIIVNEDEHPDLWWAIKGAGPCFGVATRYIAKAFPVPVVFAGNLLYRFHKATAPSLIKHFRDCVKQAPRELYANVLLTAGPANEDSLVAIQMCYIGPREKGLEYLQAISSWDGEPCLLNEVNEKEFLNQQDSVAQVLRAKAGRQWFIRSTLITSLPDEVINQTVLEFADTPIGCTWLFELAGGAIGDFENSCLPKEQREAAFTVAALHQWDIGIDDPRCVGAAEDWLDGTLKPVTQGGPFPSFLGRSDSADKIKASFGKNWDRLVEIKRKYDPKNLFRNTLWPLDEKEEPVVPSLRESEAMYDHVPKFIPSETQTDDESA